MSTSCVKIIKLFTENVRFLNCCFATLFSTHPAVLCSVPDGWNDYLEEWVAYSNWNYSLTFSLTEQQVTDRSVWLRCGGLDTVATIRSATPPPPPLPTRTQYSRHFLWGKLS